MTPPCSAAQRESDSSQRVHGETPLELPTDRGPTTLLTYNCRGLSTGKDDVTELLCKVTPHIAVVTETHLQRNQTGTKLAKSGFPGYSTWHSATDSSKGGVLLLLHHSISLTCKVDHHDAPASLRGYLLHSTITPPGGHPLTLFATYVPADDNPVTAAIYEYIRKVCSTVPQLTMVLMGDLNPNGSTAHGRHLAALKRDLRLYSLSAKRYTFRSPSTGATSELDFILSNCNPELHHTAQIPTGDCFHSDHVPIAVTHDMTRAFFFPLPLADLPPPLRPPKILEAPSKQQLDTLRDDIMSQHVDTFDNLLHALTEDEGADLHTSVDMLTDVMNHIQSYIMPKHIKMSMPKPTAFLHLPRTMSIKRRRLVSSINALTSLTPYQRGQPFDAHSHLVHSSLHTLVPADSTTHVGLDCLRDELKVLHKTHKTHRMQAARRRTQNLFSTKPKVVHAELKDPSPKEKYNMQAVYSTSVPGGVATRPPDVRRALVDHFEPLLQAPVNEHADAPFPFERETAIDPFLLQPDQPQSSSSTAADHTMDLIHDFDLFLKTVNSLPSGKATGPDGILNETIRYLPVTGLRVIHALLTRFFNGDIPPARLMESDTVLLYKKGDPRNIANYRPIGLSNTISKLWTRLLAMATSTYAELHNVLHHGQAGFRPGYYTHVQTQLMTTVIDDATRRM